MYFLPGEFKEPTKFQAPPDTRSTSERISAWGSQFAELTAAIDQERVYAKNARSDDNSLLEAYDNRIQAVADATGVTLKNPMRQPGFVMPDFRMQALGVERDEIAYNKQLYQAFDAELKGLAEKRPDAVEALRLAVPLQEDAFAISKAAQDRTEAAQRNAKDLGWFAQLGAEILGTGSGMARDPLGAVSLTVGGTNTLGRTMAGKILSRAVTEGAVNGGAEAVMQAASTDYQRKAGLKTDGFWTQVGLAAAFGGGLGGLAEGGGHVLKSLGRATPETDAALARVAAGEVSEADLRLIGDAAGVKLDDGDMASLSRAMEADADTAAVLTPDVEPRLLADTVKALEEGSPLPRVVDEVDTARVPPGLRKKVVEGNQSDIAVKQGVDAEITPQIATKEISDPSLAAFVDTENAARLSRLEDFVAMNEADIAHLRDDGALDALPSERDFSRVRGASDEHRASIVLQELEAKVAKTKAEIAARPKHSVNEPAAQIAHAKAYGQQAVLQPELRNTKHTVPASPEAVEVAAQKLATAGGTKPTAKAKPDEFVKRDTLDIMDALPGGTDAAGNPVSTTHAELTDAATRMADLADLIASCKA